MWRWLRRRPSPAPLDPSPYRASPPVVPPPPRSALVLIGLVLATAAASFCCCLSMGFYNLATDGPGVMPPSELAGPAMLGALVAAFVASALYGKARLHALEVAPLGLAAVAFAVGGGLTSHRLSAKYWINGCKRGLAGACHDASAAYRYGIGVAPDRARSLESMRRGCDLGHGWSCLGTIREDPAAASAPRCERAAGLCRRSTELRGCETVGARCTGFSW